MASKTINFNPNTELNTIIATVSQKYEHTPKIVFKGKETRKKRKNKKQNKTKLNLNFKSTFFL